MEFVYEIKGSKDKPSPFQGSVVIKKMNFKERLQFTKALDYGQDGSGDVAAVAKDKNRSIVMLEQMIELANQRTLKVDLLHSESGKKISSLSELEYYDEYGDLVTEVATEIMRAPSLGKN